MQTKTSVNPSVRAAFLTTATWVVSLLKYALTRHLGFTSLSNTDWTGMIGYTLGKNKLRHSVRIQSLDPLQFVNTWLIYISCYHIILVVIIFAWLYLRISCTILKGRFLSMSRSGAEPTRFYF